MEPPGSVPHIHKVVVDAPGIRASPVVGAPQAEIRRYLAPDECKIQPGEAHFPSGEPRGKNKYRRIQT
jgi:hypothetical protein